MLALSACRSTPTLESVLEAVARGESTDAATAREAIALASTHELVVVRRGLIDALLHLEGAEFGPEIRRAVVDVHPAIRLQAARALERWGSPEDLDALDKAAGIEEDGPTPESAGATAANAAVRIRLTGNPEPARQALEHLQSDVAQVRISGAVNLGYYRWPPSVPALQLMVRNDADLLARAMAACALGGFNADAVAPVLPQIEALFDAAPMIPRRCAVKALAASGRPEAGARVAPALQENDAMMRRWVIEGLRRLNVTAQHRQLLMSTARNDPDPATRALALRALAGPLDESVESTWRRAITDAAPRVRAAAVHELVLAGRSDVIAGALQDPAWEVRAAVLIGLTRRPAVADGVDR